MEFRIADTSRTRSQISRAKLTVRPCYLCDPVGYGHLFRDGGDRTELAEASRLLLA